MVPRSRRSLLTSMATALAATLSGCFQDSSGYQVVLENQSSSGITAHVQIVTEPDDTPVDEPPVDEEVTVEAADSREFQVAARPLETVLKLENTAGESRFNWDLPSCELGGVPTQSLVVDGDVTGVDYGCQQ